MGERICIIGGCLESKLKARGLCPRHYTQARRTGTVDDIAPKPEKKPCEAEGCTELAIGRRPWCNKHYQRMYRNGRLEPQKPGPKPKDESPDLCVPCARCGLTFRASLRQREAYRDGRLVYCSRDCQKGANLVVLPCAGCGGDVTRRKADVKGERVFHNADCRNLAPKSSSRVTLICEWCGISFPVKPSLAHARFHSVECKEAWQARNKVTRDCDQCGKSYTRAASQAGRFCTKKCEGRFLTSNAKEHVNKQGYVVRSIKSRPYLVHRLNAEAVLGRKLQRDEDVHHADTNRLNNATNGPFRMNGDGRLQSGNLIIWHHSHPRGGEVGVQIDEALGLIEQYLPQLDDARAKRLCSLAKVVVSLHAAGGVRVEG